MKILLKSALIICLGYVFLAFITPYNTFLYNRAINNQINYLLSQNGLDDELQIRYPEGYVFFNTILALSVIEYSIKHEEVAHTYSKDVDKLIIKLLSEKASERYHSNLQLSNGAFYNGWVNFTLRKYLESDLINYSNIRSYVQSSHDSITKSILESQSSGIKILDSYKDSNWPGDNLACIASLPENQFEIAHLWTTHLKAISENDLIHHDYRNLSKARGSSQSLIIYFISQYDLTLAKAESKKFHEKFMHSIFGIQFIHEDLDNKSNSDIDSGPILFRFGSVATIMNVKAQKSIGKRSKITEGFLNAIGLPINLNGKKYYIFKKEAMFDLFMLWVQV